MTDVTSRTRTATRERLLDAAWTVVVERGFGAATVDRICSSAGFTRGAFYGNFESLDALFGALYRRHTGHVLTELDAARVAVGSREPQPGPAARLDALIDALVLDRDWYIVQTEYTLHAARRPASAAVLAEHRAAFLDRLTGLLTATVGESSTVATTELARWLLALTEGSWSLSLAEGGDPRPTVRRAAALLTRTDRT